jgi:hypothetical protein
VKEEETKLNWKTAGQRTFMTIHLPNGRGNKSTDEKNIKRGGRKMSGLIPARRKEGFSQVNLKRSRQPPRMRSRRDSVICRRTTE